MLIQHDQRFSGCRISKSHAERARDYEAYIELCEVVQEMASAVDAIIVEGVHDRDALEELGVTTNIEVYSVGFNYASFVEHLMERYRRVTILTDYDRAGKSLNRRLTARLEREGVKVDRYYRDKIGRILGFRGIRTIEAITSLTRRF